MENEKELNSQVNIDIKPDNKFIIHSFKYSRTGHTRYYASILISNDDKYNYILYKDGKIYNGWDLSEVNDCFDTIKEVIDLIKKYYPNNGYTFKFS